MPVLRRRAAPGLHAAFSRGCGPGAEKKAVDETLALAALWRFLDLQGPVPAAQKSDKERRMEEEYRRCVEACPKPQIRQGRPEDVWAKNVQAEVRYDNCVHNCDRVLLRGGRK